jgi:hypothetical protein
MHEYVYVYTSMHGIYYSLQCCTDVISHLLHVSHIVSHRFCLQPNNMHDRLQ